MGGGGYAASCMTKVNQAKGVDGGPEDRGAFGIIEENPLGGHTLRLRNYFVGTGGKFLPPLVV